MYRWDPDAGDGVRAIRSLPPTGRRMWLLHLLSHPLPSRRTTWHGFCSQPSPPSQSLLLCHFTRQLGRRLPKLSRLLIENYTPAPFLTNPRRLLLHRNLAVPSDLFTPQGAGFKTSSRGFKSHLCSPSVPPATLQGLNGSCFRKPLRRYTPGSR